METSGYLNNHEIRDIPSVGISEEQAKEKLNSNLEITSSGLAIIPTEWKTEILCYEFKGKVNDLDFLVYINAKNRIWRKYIGNNWYTKRSFNSIKGRNISTFL